MALPPGVNLPYEVKTATSLESPDYDGIVLVSNKVPEDGGIPEVIRKQLQEQSKIDKNFNDDVTLFYAAGLPASRVVYAPTGNITKEYDDVRSYAEAAKKGIARALKAGVTKPLLALPSDPNFPKSEVVAALGAMETLYTNLQYREFKPDIFPKVKQLGLWSGKLDAKALENVRSAAATLESARWVARDVGGTDPERMAPPKVEEYILETFKNTPSVKINIIKDPAILDKEYPLFSAVNRAASVIERHQGRVIFLEYEPSGPPSSSLFLVGKGVTYDTGGADIKTGGNMAGMARDKCGAAVVAGFMKAVALLQPQTRVVGALAVVRNSCGENSYVSDEVVVSRAGKRIRVTNTDAEGRFAMADVLAHMAEKAKDAVNPHLFTIATLTGHACLTVGEGYSIVMDNGPARVEANAVKLSDTGEAMGDPFEISRIRREDFRFFKSKCEGEDLIQSGMKSSGTNSRGHQGPGAFLIGASGLDKFGLDGNQTLKYTHLDIAPSSGDYPHEPTGRPLVSLISHYLNQ